MLAILIIMGILIWLGVGWIGVIKFYCLYNIITDSDEDMLFCLYMICGGLITFILCFLLFYCGKPENYIPNVMIHSRRLKLCSGCTHMHKSGCIIHCINYESWTKKKQRKTLNDFI